jgi:hypothetical protein
MSSSKCFQPRQKRQRVLSDTNETRANVEFGTSPGTKKGIAAACVTIEIPDSPSSLQDQSPTAKENAKVEESEMSVSRTIEVEKIIGDSNKEIKSADDSKSIMAKKNPFACLAYSESTAPLPSKECCPHKRWLNTSNTCKNKISKQPPCKDKSFVKMKDLCLWSVPFYLLKERR